MLLSESEARTKRCTPAIVLNLMERERFDALVATGGITVRCIGPDCMQWRWAGHPELKEAGYCGLAGKP